MRVQPEHPVLFCGRCQKPFNSETSLKRHGYYCQSRELASSSRRRSCITCAKAKTRCDLTQPICARCETHKVECVYPAQHARESRCGLGGDQQSASASACSSQQTQVQAPVGVDILLDEAVNVTDYTLPGDYTWTSSDDTVFDFINTDANDQAFLFGSSPLKQTDDLATLLINGMQSASNSQTIPRSPSNAVRSLIRRPQRVVPGVGNANLILINFKSFLFKIRRYDSMPPFIHSSVVAGDVGIEPFELLNNSIALLRMVDSEVSGSQRLFWSSVQIECEYMCSQCTRYTNWQLIAALQALFLYILVRMDEGETEHNNLDYLLLQAVTAVRTEINVRTFYTVTSASTSAWRNWLFEESARRTCVVYQILDLLVFFEAAALCKKPPHVLLGPLPRNKDLWERKSAVTWQREQQKLGDERNEYAVALNGDLVQLKIPQSDPCRNDVMVFSPENKTATTRTTTWAEWTASMDDIGNLILLAASTQMS